ncbi:MAG: molybdenum cofactor guanylyltransferase MobA [Rhodobacteraceae bacterium]|nr:molybdenum cofactor guanylyltransferase MobA [Paracoccaceae bacterium]
MTENEWMGVILAGGQSRRMGGGDKCILSLGQKPLLAHVIDRLAPQFAAGRAAIALNANGEPSRFAPFGLPVIPDPVAGFLGPLVGVLAGLEWAAERGARGVVTAAADTPFPPSDLVSRLIAAAENAQTPLACAASGGRDHPTFGLWPVALRADLRRALVEEDLRKVVLWTDRHGCARASFDDHIRPGPAGDPFFNVNTPEDLDAARAQAAHVPEA